MILKMYINVCNALSFLPSMQPGRKCHCSVAVSVFHAGVRPLSRRVWIERGLLLSASDVLISRPVMCDLSLTYEGYFSLSRMMGAMVKQATREKLFLRLQPGIAR